MSSVELSPGSDSAANLKKSAMSTGGPNPAVDPENSEVHSSTPRDPSNSFIYSSLGNAVTRTETNPSAQLIQTLRDQAQEHIIEMLSPESPLPPERRASFIKELAAIDWEGFYSNRYDKPSLDNVTPTQQFSLAERATARGVEMEASGRAAYMNGEVSVLLVAGGDGSRLGFNQPKGCYPVGPVSEDTLYQKIAEKILSASLKFGHDIPFVIMTGPGTDKPTREYFAANSNFGLKPEQVFIFQQDTLPTVDVDGKLLLKGPGELLTNPNGHGGSVDGMMKSGALDYLMERGIKDIVYIQVDNALAPIFDPFAVGLRRQLNADIVNKGLAKVDAEEKMGALVKVGGHDGVVEYSDLSSEQKHMKNPDGSLLFGIGNVAAHVVGVDFLDSLRSSHFHLPYHEARKEVSAWKGAFDSAGQPIVEKTPGIKREMFFFDTMAHAECVCVEVSRPQEFAPIKNASGQDSPESSRKLMNAEYHRWCEESGVKVADHVVIEVSPLFAANAEEFRVAIAANPRAKAAIEAATDKIYVNSTI